MREHEFERFDNYLLDSESYIKNYLSVKDHMVHLALDNEKVVGFMIASHTTNYIMSLVLLYVGQHYRRQGIARLLKTALERLSKMRGYTQIVSQVRTNNAPSIALNNKAGWTAEPDKIYPDSYVWFTKDL